MTEDRMMVAKAVLFDGLDASYLTMDEIRELEDLIFEAVAEKRSHFQTFEVMQ
jgi:hypothetical protein